ncbi:uncharacterized protein [Musca autumnalis]|uniref:uncharacterized protein n=1 Tax=Musca autumnalis TaxID=221902 RepID=UPI003CF2E9AC
MRILTNLRPILKLSKGSSYHGPWHHYTSLVQVLQSKRLFNSGSKVPVDLTIHNSNKGLQIQKSNKSSWIEELRKDGTRNKFSTNPLIDNVKIPQNISIVRLTPLAYLDVANPRKFQKNIRPALKNQIVLLEIATIEFGNLPKFHKTYALLYFRPSERNVVRFEIDFLQKLFETFGRNFKQINSGLQSLAKPQDVDGGNHWYFLQGSTMDTIGNREFNVFIWKLKSDIQHLNKSAEHGRISQTKLCQSYDYKIVSNPVALFGNVPGNGVIALRHYSTDSKNRNLPPKRQVSNDVSQAKTVYYNSPFVLELLGGHKFPLSPDTYRKAVEEANRLRQAGLKNKDALSGIKNTSPKRPLMIMNKTFPIDSKAPMNRLSDKGSSKDNAPSIPPITDKGNPGKHHRKEAPTGCVSPKCKKGDPCSKLGPAKDKKASAGGMEITNLILTDVSMVASHSNKKVGSGLCNGCSSFSGKDKNKPGSSPPKPGSCSKDKGKSKKPGPCTDDDKPYQPKCNKNPCDGDSGTKPQSPCATKKDPPKKGPCASEKKVDGKDKQPDKGPPKPAGPKETPKTTESCANKKDGPFSSKKPSPCGKKDKPQRGGPCSKKNRDPCAKKPGPCGKKSTPCGKKPSPCGKKDKSEPCSKKDKGPCTKKPSSCDKMDKPKTSPCGKQDKPKPSPCGKKDQPKPSPCGKKDQPKPSPCGKKDQPKPSPCGKKDQPKPSPCGKKDQPKPSPCGKKDQPKPCGKKDKPNPSSCGKKEEPKTQSPCSKKPASPCDKPPSPCGKEDKPKTDTCAKKPPNPCDKKVRPQPETNQFPCTRGPCAEKKKPSIPCKNDNPCTKKSSPCGKKNDNKSDTCVEKTKSNTGCSKDQHPCGKKPKDTKPKCKPKGDLNKKCYSTFTSHVGTPSPSTLNRNFHCFSFSRCYSSSKDKKDAVDLGIRSKCKSFEPKLPAHRQREKDHKRPTKEGLRSCYPAYDMDCPKKLCKDPHKTACSKYNNLKGVNKNDQGKK